MKRAHVRSAAVTIAVVATAVDAIRVSAVSVVMPVGIAMIGAARAAEAATNRREAHGRSDSATDQPFQAGKGIAIPFPAFAYQKQVPATRCSTLLVGFRAVQGGRISAAPAHSATLRPLPRYQGCLG